MLGVVSGLFVGLLGLALLLARALGQLGTILPVAGFAFAVTMLASLWIYRSQN